VGGINGKGEDVTNELSYLCLDAIGNVRTPAPALSVLFHKKSPHRLYLKAAELVRLGLGHPSCFNSEILHLQLLQRDPGCTLVEILEKGAPIGCVEPGVHGKHYGHTDAGIMNFASIMELTMNRGIKPAWSQGNGLGRRIGLETPDPRSFKSFDELMGAVKYQMAYLVEILTSALIMREKITADERPETLASILTEGMIEKGEDVSTQSAPMSIGGAIMGIGLADLANSLMAIKKVVFEEKKATMDELCKALEKDFEGYEILRQRLKKAPKYGNDLDEVDSIARDLGDHFAREVRKHEHLNGVRSVAGIQPTSVNVPMGELVGALPSSRKKGEPLADAASAEHGTDEEGITALMRSYGKLNHKYFTDGTVINIWVDKSTFESDRGITNFCNLLKTYFDLGGYHVQFNCQDKETLVDAQKRPEKYPTLMVRVAGYSVYFVDLCQSIQDDIIARTVYKASG
jgi:formate C-acetyltransferase